MIHLLLKSDAVKALLFGVAAALIYLFVLTPLALFELPALKTQDLFFKVRYLTTEKPEILDDILLLTIDDESLKYFKEKWPLKRERYAQLLNRITPYQPKLVGFDFVFSGKGDPVGDFKLASAIEQSGRVVLAAFVDPNGNFVVSKDEIARGATASGVVNKLLDPDYHVRRTALRHQGEEGEWVSWPWEVELFNLYRGLTSMSPQAQQAQSDPKTTKINYRFKLHDVSKISFWEALQSSELKERVQDKIVVIGTTSQALHDFHQTPLGLMPGVVINLNFFANLVNGDDLVKLPQAAELISIFLFVFLAAVISLKRDALSGSVYLLCATAVLVFIYFCAFTFNVLGDIFSSLVLGWVTFLILVFYRSFGIILENARLKGKVVTDPLTGLYNRRALEERIDGELEKLVNVKGGRKTDPISEVSLLMIDIDDFKKLNDAYGHPFGDDVLKNVGFVIRENTRENDLAARYGGEEFCIVLSHTTKDQALSIGEKIRSAVAECEYTYVNKIAKVTVSCGVAGAKSDALFAARSLIRAADQALYMAKREGKNRVVPYRSPR
jgi:diguanylate cyclase (GGDEF)-like protein